MHAGVGFGSFGVRIEPRLCVQETLRRAPVQGLLLLNCECITLRLEVAPPTLSTMSNAHMLLRVKCGVHYSASRAVGC